MPRSSVFGLLFFIGALSLAVWGLERDPPYDVFRGYTHTFETDDIGGGGDGDEHERLTRKQQPPPSHIPIWSWENSLFSTLALWGNKNWPPSMKVKKFKFLQNKMGLKGCKWSSLNAVGTETPQSHP